MQENCSRQIGVWGDRTCSALETEIHCHNCPVYSQIGQELLERPEPEGYTAEWTALVAQPNRDRQGASQGDRHSCFSATIFRLGQEWLALPASCCEQILDPSPVRALPHRRDPLLRGIVNARGQLLPCVSLHELLGIPVLAPAQPASNAAALPGASLAAESSQGISQTIVRSGQQGGYPRLVVIQTLQEKWAFEVDELYGLHRGQSEELRSAPTLGDRALTGYTQSIFSWHDRNVSYLSADRLFSSLRERAL